MLFPGHAALDLTGGGVGLGHPNGEGTVQWILKWAWPDEQSAYGWGDGAEYGVGNGDGFGHGNSGWHNGLSGLRAPTFDDPVSAGLLYQFLRQAEVVTQQPAQIVVYLGVPIWAVDNTIWLSATTGFPRAFSLFASYSPADVIRRRYSVNNPF